MFGFLDDNLKLQMASAWLCPQDVISLHSSSSAWLCIDALLPGVRFAVSRCQHGKGDLTRSAVWWDELWLDCKRAVQQKGWPISVWRSSCRCSRQGRPYIATESFFCALDLILKMKRQCHELSRAHCDRPERMPKESFGITKRARKPKYIFQGVDHGGSLEHQDGTTLAGSIPPLVAARVKASDGIWRTKVVMGNRRLYALMNCWNPWAVWFQVIVHTHPELRTIRRQNVRLAFTIKVLHALEGVLGQPEVRSYGGAERKDKTASCVIETR